MQQRKVNRLPVVDQSGRPVGIVTRADLLEIFLRSDAEIHDEVVHDVLEHALAVNPALFHTHIDQTASEESRDLAR